MRQRGFVKALVIVGLAIVALAVALQWLARQQAAAVQRPLLPAGAGPEYYVFAPGSSLETLSRDLQARGWLNVPEFLIWEGRRRGLAGRLQAGEYAIRPDTTARSLLEDMVAGRVVQHAVTLVEGWTFAQALEALWRHPVLTATLEGQTPEAIMQTLGRPDEHPEGRFYPDTYHFTRGASDRDILARALARMDAVLAELWPGRAEGLPLASPYEALVLASIVEKETALAEERPLIAGVFVRRLKLGMRLQTDPTVIYGLGERFDGNLRKADLLENTPYNTYQRTGLTPTPIALPGRQAIEAVLNPAPGEALYFVARGDGSHVFSRSLDEHNRAVARHQLGAAAAEAPQ